MISINLNTNDLANLHVFAWWGTIIVLKLLAMVPLIGRQRYNKRIFISPEDTKILRGSKAGCVDEDIERVRRAHLNDLENILPWAISTALWLTTSPDPATASFFIKSFCISRIIHTIVYAVIVIPQPARFLAYGAGYLITIYQSIETIHHYINKTDDNANNIQRWSTDINIRFSDKTSAKR
ncbi:hypothetical protein PV327_008636 [Microctonus hyperodae]|uniref:Microsomal glutathione S-transferase 1 n=1 Tax=Microctonus hyperodae TaxID=165561 RepID=A0AA39F3J8_MICHY|nr:hypothetical protein PV327_008636 [Microctonus hyperodae]